MRKDCVAIDGWTHRFCQATVLVIDPLSWLLSAEQLLSVSFLCSS